MNDRMRQLLLTLIAAVAAIIFAAIVTGIILLITGIDPFSAYQAMISYGTQATTIADILNKASYYIITALAVAVGFRMNLFNIGVEGQYRMGGLFAAWVGAEVNLPPVLHQLVMIIVAMVVGAAWAAIAGVLKVTRGVSEVISTIMLNYVAYGVIAYLLTPKLFAVSVQGSNNLGTKQLPKSGQIPGIPFPGSQDDLYGFVLLALALVFIYHLVVNRTRFGFDLRASGLNPWAASASGVDAKRMVVAAMLISGAVAGLAGLPLLMGDAHTYTATFPQGWGFIGIAIALLGRNSPAGIVFAGLLWAFLDQSSQILDINSIPKEVVQIMEGTVVLSVVVAYEVVRRIGLRRQQRVVGERTGVLPEGASA